MNVSDEKAFVSEDFNDTESSATTTTAHITDTVKVIVTSLVTLTTTRAPKRITCMKSELSEPEFYRYACEGSRTTSWIAAVFLLSMIIYNIIKCLTSTGVRNIFDLRLNGIGFPKRPEFFVLFCSTIPLVFTLTTRPLLNPLPCTFDHIIRGWGLAQTRFFFDLFTRTATNYHMVYWAYRTPLINLLWRIQFDSHRFYTEWKNRPKPEKKPVENSKKIALTLRSKPKSTLTQQPIKRAGRTKEHGVAKKRDRTKSVRSSRSNSKAPSQASTETAPKSQTNQNSAVSVNLITPQRLFTDQNDLMNPYNMIMSGGMNDQMQAFGQNNPFMFSNPYGAYGQMMQFSSMGMGPNHLNQQLDPHADPKNAHLHEPAGSSAKRKFFKSVRLNVERPPPTREFCIRCKRIIPGCIYLLSLIATLPAIFAFEIEPAELRFRAVKCTLMCRSYFYYDMIGLVVIPTLLILIGFYHAVLARKQLNGGLKSKYRLRCYYVTFIILNIPMFVIMATSVSIRLGKKVDDDIYGTLILIGTTAYHANFVLKSTVYTTGCNCICCSQALLKRSTVLNKLLNYFTTPVYLKDKKHTFKGTIIKVTSENEPADVPNI